MKNSFDKLPIYLLIVLLIESIICMSVIILITNGIRINRESNYGKDNVELTKYEQVYHVFMKQEIFLTVENKSDKMIGTITVKEKKSGKTETLHKIRPGKSVKMYFSLDSYFEKVEFEIVELRFVEM